MKKILLITVALISSIVANADCKFVNKTSKDFKPFKIGSTVGELPANAEQSREAGSFNAPGLSGSCKDGDTVTITDAGVSITNGSAGNSAHEAAVRAAQQRADRKPSKYNFKEGDQVECRDNDGGTSPGKVDGVDDDGKLLNIAFDDGGFDYVVASACHPKGK